MIPLPIRDDVPVRRAPIATYAIIAANVLVWLFELAHGVLLSTLDYGVIPAWLLHGVRDGRLDLPGIGLVRLHQELPPPLTLVSSMFMHGGWLHIIGNMWFLWIFGDNVEDTMGRLRFVLFYLLAGGAAAMAQVLLSADSTLPMVGASGAIAGVLGAYALLYPRARVRCLWVLVVFVTFIDVPAWALLGLWLLSQFFLPLGAPTAGVAWIAHVGGFAFGIVTVRLFTVGRWPRPRSPRLQPLDATPY